MKCKCGNPVHWLTYGMCGDCVRKCIPAQVGTHPKGGDAKQAPGDSLSDAVGEADAPKTYGYILYGTYEGDRYELTDAPNPDPHSTNNHA